MIARHWRGWTSAKNAEAYLTVLRTKVLPGLKGLQGYQGGRVLRRDERDEVEFVVINYFDSLDSVKRFAGANYQVAVIEPEARPLLLRAEPNATHFDVAEDITV